MLFGIQAAQDVKLSQIGRELHEPIRLEKVENRLSRNLALNGMDETLHDCLLLIPLRKSTRTRSSS